MGDSDVGKLFVGGISRDTTDDALRDHFSEYGVVSSAHIAKDRLTGFPRGFGFVTFSDPSSVDSALLDSHLINGRPVDVKRARPRNDQLHIQKQLQQQQHLPSPVHSQMSKGVNGNNNGVYGGSNGNQSLKAKKIFVGGLSANLTEEEFKAYFEKFGRITDVVVMHDNNTNRPRGFGFITFDSEEVVEKIMQTSHHELAGKQVEVKKAIPREVAKNGINSKFGNGRFSAIANYGTDECYWPAYGSYPGQLLPSTSYAGYYYGNGGVYSGGYPFAGGYGFYGCGTPVVPPRSPLNSFGLMPGRPVNYGTGYYPTGLNGGFPILGVVNPGVMDFGARPPQDFRSNTQVQVKEATPKGSSTRADGDGSSLKMGKDDANVKKNLRSSDVQAQPTTVSAQDQPTTVSAGQSS